MMVTSAQRMIIVLMDLVLEPLSSATTNVEGQARAIPTPESALLDLQQAQNASALRDQHMSCDEKPQLNM